MRQSEDIRKKQREKEDGAIIIEATISFTAFMFLVVMLLSITDICLAQVKMGMLVNGIAKDMSNYSYIYTFFDLDDKEQNLANQAQQANGEIKDVASKLTSQNIDEMMQGIGTLADDFQDDSFWNSMKYALAQSAVDGGKNLIVQKLCKYDTEKRFVGKSGGDADAYLKRLGVVGGLNGIDFSHSQFCPGGKDDIIIVAVYDVRVLDLLGIDYKFHFVQSAHTRAWKSVK